MSKPEPLHYSTTYHLFNRGNNRETLFRQHENYLHFLHLYTKHFYPFAETFAYCLLPNHFHFLIRTHSESRIKAFLEINREDFPKFTSLSHSFGNVCNAYTRAYNRRFQRTGALFDPRFKRWIVENQGYFKHLLVYVHQNPQKHGLINDLREWPYSSYNLYLEEKPTRLEKESVRFWYGGKRGYFDAHNSWIGNLGDDEL